MRADYINPFIKSLNRVFQTMLGCEVRRGQPYLKVTGSSDHPISGVIGLSGQAMGTVVLSLSEEVNFRWHNLLEPLREKPFDLVFLEERPDLF